MQETDLCYFFCHVGLCVTSGQRDGCLITIAVPCSLKVISAFYREGWTHIPSTKSCLSQMWIPTCTAGKDSVYPYASTAGRGNVVHWVGSIFSQWFCLWRRQDTLHLAACVSISFPPGYSACLNFKPFQAGAVSCQVFVSHTAKCFVLSTWIYRHCYTIFSIYFFILLS